jgi:hypothetical protein
LIYNNYRLLFSWDHNFSPKGNVKAKFVQAPKKIQDIFGEAFFYGAFVGNSGRGFFAEGVAVADREAGGGALFVKKAPSCRLDIFLEQLL